MSQESPLDRFYKLSVGMVACCVLVFSLYHLGLFLNGLVVMFGITLVITYILLAPVNLMEPAMRILMVLILRALHLNRFEAKIPSKMPRAASILLVYVVTGILLVVLCVRFLPVAFKQLQEYVNEMPQYVQQAEDWILTQPLAHGYFKKELILLEREGKIAGNLGHSMRSSRSSGRPQDFTTGEKQALRENVFPTSNSVNAYIRQNIRSTLTNLMLVLSTTVSGLVYTLSGLMLMFYFLLDGSHLRAGFIRMLPQSSRRTAGYLLDTVHNAMFRFIEGKMIIGGITGIYMIMLYWLLDVPFAILLGAFFAFAELLPVVGPIIGMIPVVFVLLFVNPVKLLVVLSAVYFCQMVKDSTIAPKILGDATGLHPVIVFTSLLICAKIAGLIGFLYAIPLASMINALIRFFQEESAQSA